MSTLTGVLVAVAAFCTMEPVTYLAHRFVMHGIGWTLHRSHHAAAAGRFEANDAFPLIFGSCTVVAMALGFNDASLRFLVAVTAGITLYGAAYGFVHDVYIHGRLGRRPRLTRIPVLERLRRAHGLHHRFGGEPYGMLLPVVPRALRARAALGGHRAARAPLADEAKV